MNESDHLDNEVNPSGKTENINYSSDNRLQNDLAFSNHDKTQHYSNSNLFGEDNPRTIERYKIISKIGQGGMGKVFKAYDPKLKREIAVKTIIGNPDEVLIRRFIKEAEAMAAFSHANIIKIYDMGKDKNFYYFTMDFVNGKNLSEIVKNATLSIKEAARILYDVAMAIDYAHSHNILHRDIKPANIMLNENSQVVVMDFGLAKVFSRRFTKNVLWMGM